MKQDDPQFKFRIPSELKRKLDGQAEVNTRTLGAEIVARLQSSFEVSDEMVLLKATHAYDQSLNTSLMREKAGLQAQLAKKDAEIQILKQRLFLGTMDVPEVDDESRPVNKRELIQLLNEFVASNNGEVTFKTKVVPDEAAPAANKPTVNKVILVGNLGRDPEVRYLPSGAPATIQSALPPKKTTKRPPKVIGPGGSKRSR